MDPSMNIFLSQAGAVSFDHHSAVQIGILILMGFFSGLLIAWVYKHTFQGIGYTSSFIFSLVFLTAISTLVIVAIGESVARAFALAGALSIIRFRTPIKDTRDMTFLFLSLIVGLSLGTGKVVIALSALLAICALILAFHYFQSRALQAQRAVIRVQLNSGSTLPSLGALLNRVARSARVLDLVREAEDGQATITYLVRLKDATGVDALLSAIRELPQVANCTARMQFDGIDI